jgi:stearoyl-CoA desaturase (delta-9 desaturase)
MMIIITFFIAHWYLSLFSQSFFQHRYAAHRSFIMNKFWERFFFVFAYITQGSSYMSPRVYAIIHRLHHAYADTDQDPHSPAFDTSPFNMMTKTSKFYMEILHERIQIDEKFTKNLPSWTLFDNWCNTWYSRILWTIIYISFYIIFAPSAFYYVLIPVHVLMGPIHGVIINWFAHKYGKANFLTDNTSKNLFKVDILMMGEGYHNNHHKFPSRKNFALNRGEVDFCYLIIILLGFFKVIETKQHE